MCGIENVCVRERDSDSKSKSVLVIESMCVIGGKIL